jgi:hypothetical protein
VQGVDALTEADREALQRKIDACGALMLFAVRHVLAHSELKRAHDWLLQVLFSRITTTYQAALNLAAAGYGDQVQMLDRALFEAMVDLHWIAANPELALQRYDEHYRHSILVRLEEQRKHPEFTAPTDLPREYVGVREELDRVFGRYGQRSWTGVGLHARVKALIAAQDTDAERREIDVFYGIVNRVSNTALHPSPLSLHRSIRDMGSEALLGLEMGPSPHQLEAALLCMYWTYARAYMAMQREFEHPDRDELWQLYGDGWETFRR